MAIPIGRRCKDRLTQDKDIFKSTVVNEASTRKLTRHLY